MKSKLKLLIVKGEAGFAIPIVLGVGLIMILIATMMLLRSQGDRSLATAQKSSSQALIAAETGITRVQELLNRYRSLATIKNINATNSKWSSFITNNTDGLGCPTVADLDPDPELQKLDAADSTKANDGWADIYSGTDSLEQQYRVISYEYNSSNNQGTLIVEGRTKQGDIVRSTARLQVAIPIVRKPPTTFKPPAIWARDYNLGTNTFKVDTAIQFGCTTTPPLAPTQFAPKTVTPNTAIISDRSLALPKVSLPPECPAPASFTPVNKPCYIKITPPVTASATFPRPQDVVAGTGYGTDGTGENKEYIYYIPKTGTNSVNLDLTGTDKISVPFDPNSPNSQKVTLYLEGNFKATVDRLCPPPPPPVTPPAPPPLECRSTDLQILGIDTEEVTVKSNGNTDAIIMAPKAVAKLEGNGQIRGAIWVKTWGPSLKNGIVLEQPDKWEWNDLPPALKQIAIPPSVAPYTAWQRQEIQ